MYAITFWGQMKIQFYLTLMLRKACLGWAYSLKIAGRQVSNYSAFTDTKQYIEHEKSGGKEDAKQH